MSLKLNVLARRLWPRAAFTDAASHVERARESADGWKQRFERRNADVERLRAAVDDLRRHIRQLDERARIRKRSQLSHAILKGLLPLRALERPLPAGDRAAGEERARRFVEASPEYAAMAEDNDARQSCLIRGESGGLTWWFPRDEATIGRMDKLQRQTFPLRAILQTREVALGGVMLDIGANIGRTSLPRVMLGDVRAVYAAEPDPVNYACLVQNIIEHQLCGFVMPDRVAIGATRGEVALRRSHYVGGHHVLRKSGATSAQTVPVQLWPLDEWVNHIGVNPREVSFVKVDTQGLEVEVLRGASNLLQCRHVAWQMEVDPGLLTRAGTSMNELLGILASRFTHFIDIGGSLPGERHRSTDQLPAALEYLGSSQKKTDLVLFTAR